MATRSARQRRSAAMDDASACPDLEQEGSGARGGGAAPAPAHFSASASDAAEAPFSLDGDRGSLALLLLLYTLQGVPMGLASSVSFVLQERGGSYADQGVFSFVSWPFSLKILWAPLVDSLFFRSVGQRRTWLLPVQTLVGVLLLGLGGQVQSLLDGDGDGVGGVGGGAPRVRPLTALFFALYLLMATQDVAVDGWALTLLSRRNVGLASPVNAVGQTLGYFAAFTGYLALAEHGLATLPGFMRCCGALFLASAAAVWATREAAPPEGAVPSSVADVYAQAGRLLRLRPMRTLLGVLLTCRVAFAATDGLATLKLMEKGVSKTHLAYLSSVQIVIPMLMARWTSGGAAPWAAFLSAYAPRLAVGAATAALVAAAPQPGAPRAAFFAAAAAVMAAQAALSQLQFVAQMAFFARISDPTIGGTAMTLLNTVANLGSKWPNSVVLFAAAALERRPCAAPGGAAMERHGCGDAAARAACAAAGGACAPRGDGDGGFALLTAGCTLLGVAWLALMQGRVRAMAALPPSAWVAPPPRP